MVSSTVRGVRYGGRFWQRYGFERVLRDDESILAAVRYILANPIRTGLAKRVEDYPFTGSLVYTLEQLIEGVYESNGTTWSG